MFRVGAKRSTWVNDAADDSAVEIDVAPDDDVGDYLGRNRKAWEQWAPASSVSGHKAWQADQLRWGLWDTPETTLGLLQGIEPDADVIELGCGTGALCAWLERSGLYPVGVDFSRAQLATAEEFQREFGVSYPLIFADAEQVPYDQENFDLAISEYGASIWCSPRRWLPEAHRLLRPGGHLIFFTPSSFLMACTPENGGEPGAGLVRDYFSTYRVQFDVDGPVEFHLTHGQWVRLLRATGFTLENLIELRPAPRAEPRYDIVSVEWARRWPTEEIWIARKTPA
jgi:SAM-dependent methyltransferase